jgi:methionine synthase II (cobalamin-independent)
MADDFRYHIDHHGSLVRPAGLRAARAAGEPEALAAAEEEAVIAALHTQRRLGLSAVGDGQFRREHFESVVYDHVEGFGPAAGPGRSGPAAAGSQPLADAAGIPAARRRRAPAGPAATGRLADAEAATPLANVERPVFVVLPSPGYLAAVGSALADPEAIDAARASAHALAAIIRAEIRALAGQGVAYVALGNPLYPPLLTVAGRERLANHVDVDAVLNLLVEADRAAVTELEEIPENFRVGLDLTDSGPVPTTERGYHQPALDALLDETPFHRLCTDFPADPAARLPVAAIKPGLVLSLGVVDTSTAVLETVEALLERLDPVFEQRGDVDVAIATNSGFAASADRPLMSEDEQRAKLRLVETAARYYWGNEI